MKPTYISVCKNTILQNLKRGTKKPVMRVSKGKYGRPEYYNFIELHGTVRVHYSPDKPMPWGARVWIEHVPDGTAP